MIGILMDGLKHEQAQAALLMGQDGANKPYLEYALALAVDTLRSLKRGEMTPADAWKAYIQITAVTSENTVQVGVADTERQQQERVQRINGLLRRWYLAGLISLDGDMLELTRAGYTKFMSEKTR